MALPIKNGHESEMRYLFAARDFIVSPLLPTKRAKNVFNSYMQNWAYDSVIWQKQKGFSRLISDRSVSNKYRKLARNRWESYKYDEHTINANESIGEILKWSNGGVK